MKITDPGIIKNGEKDLIESLKADLDLEAVRAIIQKKLTAAALSPKGGEIVVFNNEIAFRMDFELSLKGSLMFDRQGNHIPADDMPQEIIVPSYEDKPENPRVETKNDIEDSLDLMDEDLDSLDDLDELTETGEPEPALDETGSLLEDDSLISDDLADDDISDILKESRDFWEKKKDA